MNMPGAAEWSALFAEYLIKTTLLLSLCLLLVSLCRGRTAAIRHFLLSFFLIGLLLLPVVSTFRFGWETGLLPARLPFTADQGVRDSSRPSGGGYAGRDRLFPGPRPWRPGADSPSAAYATPEPEFPSAPVPFRMLGTMIPWVWSAGLSFLVLRFGLSTLGASRLVRGGQEVTDPSWRALLARCLAAIRIRRAVRLKSHGGIGVPITWGLLKPVILIPRGHGEWTDDQRSSALLHEICHIKRGDLLVMYLVRLSAAVFWFNPLCWIACRRLQREQERACDELVLTAGIKPSTYAATLLFFKRAAGLRPHVPAAFVGLIGGNSFDLRLAAILRQKLNLKEVAMKTRIALAIAVMLAVSLIGLARPARSRSESNPDPHPGVLALQSAVPPVPAAAQTPEQGGKTETRQDQGKKKEEQKSRIVIRNREGEKAPIEITITAGDSARTIQVEPPLTIKEGKEGGLILLDPAGKEIEVFQGEQFRVAIEGKGLTVVKESDPVKSEKVGVLRIISSKGQARTVRVKVTPEMKIQKRVETPVEIIPGERVRDLKTLPKERPAAAPLKLAPGKEKPVVVWDLKQAEKATEAKLAKQEVQKAAGSRLTEKSAMLVPAKTMVITRTGSGLRLVRAPGKGIMTSVRRDGGSLTMVFGLSADAEGREMYDRIVAGIRQVLPENYASQPEFDETSGAVTLKITGAGMPKVPTELIRKILDVVERETK